MYLKLIFVPFSYLRIKRTGIKFRRNAKPEHFSKNKRVFGYKQRYILSYFVILTYKIFSYQTSNLQIFIRVYFPFNSKNKMTGCLENNFIFIV